MSTTHRLQPETDAAPASRLDDLAQIVAAYNRVTEKLQRSHEALNAEVNRLRRQLASADAQLQRSKRLAALGEMAAGIAHEVRNPLAAIQLYARMIGDDLTLASPNTRAAAENAGKIAEAVRGLNAIVTDVLHFAREIHPRRTPVSPATLIPRALAAHQPAIEREGVQLVVHAADDLLLEVDGELMHQALLNLIRNAVEAMAGAPTQAHITARGDAARRRLTIAVRREGEDGVLTVADTGPGIAEADIDRLFNPFFTTRNTGTGLGLAIVHRIVDAHGGSIAVHNADGAVFTLHLPHCVRCVETVDAAGVTA